MKKLIISLLVAVFVSLLLVLTVGAQEINKNTTFALTGSFTDVNGNTVTSVNLYDADGDALIWYLNTDQKIVSAKAADLITVDENGVTSFKDTSIFYEKSTTPSVIVVNLRSNVKNATVNYDGQIKHFGDVSHNEFANKDKNCTSGFQFGGYNVKNAQIQAFYVPKSAQSLYKRMFQSTPVRIVDIEPGTAIEVIGVHCFNSATKLEEIFIPKGVTSFMFEDGAGMFTGCSSLKTVTFEEGSRLENAGCFTFWNCGSLTKLYLPNSVKTFGHRFIQNCSSLKEFSFGASFEYFDYHKEFGKNNQDMWMMHSTRALEKVYIPATIDLSTYSATGWKQIFDSANSTFKIYYTGSAEQFDSLVAKFKEAGTNGNIINAVSEGRVNYVTSCQAFYGNNHALGEGKYMFLEGDYVSSYAYVSGCTRTGCTEKDEDIICGALVTNKGYSKETNGTYFSYTVTFDYENIEKYENKTGKAFSYGLIAAKDTGVENGILIDSEGKALYESTSVVFDVTNAKYSIYQIKLTGITGSYTTQPVYCGAYVIDGAEVSYIGDDVTKEAKTISYEDVTSPSQDDSENEA